MYLLFVSYFWNFTVNLDSHIRLHHQPSLLAYLHIDKNCVKPEDGLQSIESTV